MNEFRMDASLRWHDKWWVKRLYKVFGLIIIVFALLLSALRLTMMFPPSPAQITQWVNQQIPYPVKIQGIKLAWQGVNPIVTLDHVDVYSKDKNIAFEIQKIRLALSPWQLLLKRLEMKELLIEGAQIGIEHHPNGHFSVSGLPELEWDPADTRAAKVSFKRLVIANSDIHLMLDQNRSIPLTNTIIRVDNHGHLKVRGQAKVVGLAPTKIQFGMNSPGMLFKSKGTQFYTHVQTDNVAQFADFFPKDLPIVVNQGKANIHSWIQIMPHERIRVDGQVKLEAIHAKTVKNETDWKLAAIEAEFTAKRREGAWDLVGEIGEMDFHLQQDSKDPKKTFALSMNHVDLNKGQYWMQILALVPTQWQTSFDRFKVQGTIDQLQVTVDSQQGVQFAQVAFTDFGAQDGIAKTAIGPVSGAVKFAGDKGELWLQSTATEVTLPKLFNKPLPITDLNALLMITKHDQQLQITAEKLNGKYAKTPFESTFSMRFAADQTLPDVDILVELDKIAVKDALHALPRVYMDDDLVKWLDQSLLSGTLESTAMVLRGNLAEFPFDDHQGMFEVHSALTGVELQYDKEWPTLHELKTDLIFRNRSMLVAVEKATIDGGIVEDVDAIIPDLGAKVALLTVDTKILSRLENGMKVIESSPLKSTLGKTLSAFQFQGPMELSLDIDIPLTSAEHESVKVKGVINTQDAAIQAKAWQLDIQKLNGEIQFTENSIQANGLKGELLGMPTQFTIQNVPGENESQVLVGAQGKISVAQLNRWFTLPQADLLSGETDYHAHVLLSTTQPSQAQLSISSSLLGMGIQAPQPLGKSAQQARPLEVKIYFEPQDLVRLTAKYGDDLNLAYSVHNINSNPQFLGSHIHVGEKRLAKARDDGICVIDGELKEVNFQEWKTFLAGFDSLATARSSRLFVEPLVQLQVEKLMLGDQVFGNTKIEAEWQAPKQHWNINLDGAAIKGLLVYSKDDKQDLVIDLQKLILTKSDKVGTDDSNEPPPRLPRIIEAKIAQLEFNQRQLQDVQIRIEPTQSGYAFTKLKAQVTGADLNFTGRWEAYLPFKPVTMEGKIVAQNLGASLEALKLGPALRKSKGTIQVSLQWQGTPWKLDYPTLSGQADLNLQQGYVDGVKTGFGRVLSLLSLDNVKRRLNLDFSDVTKNGFPFNDLKGKFQFGKGKVSANNIMLNGPSAKIEAFGQADLQSQKLDGEMIVKPNLTGSLPIAAAIAVGNPAVGAAVWLVDRVVGNKIQDISRFRYQILGTWQSPNVKELPMNITAKGN